MSKGRTAKGYFAKGNKFGKGNPHFKKITAYRMALLKAIDEDDVREVVLVLMQKAKAGEDWAIKEFLNRTVGKAVPASELPDGVRLSVIRTPFTPPLIVKEEAMSEGTEVDNSHAN